MVATYNFGSDSVYIGKQQSDFPISQGFYFNAHAKFHENKTLAKISNLQFMRYLAHKKVSCQ